MNLAILAAAVTIIKKDFVKNFGHMEFDDQYKAMLIIKDRLALYGEASKEEYQIDQYKGDLDTFVEREMKLLDVDPIKLIDFNDFDSQKRGFAEVMRTGVDRKEEFSEFMKNVAALDPARLLSEEETQEATNKLKGFMSELMGINANIDSSL